MTGGTKPNHRKDDVLSTGRKRGKDILKGLHKIKIDEKYAEFDSEIC